MKREKEILNSLKSGEWDHQNDIHIISSGDDDCSNGMKNWIMKYHQSIPGLEVLQHQIDDFITAHEGKLEEERKSKEALTADGGWTVIVHHKGRKKTTDSESGIVVGSVTQAVVENKLAKKKHKEVGLDFYRFQKRKAQRNEEMAGGELLDRVQAKAKRGPAKRPVEETLSPQEPANTPGAGAVLGLESARPPSKKKRVKGDEAKGGAVDSGGPHRGELPPWLVRLSEVGRGDPILVCSEICRVASDKLKQVAGDRKEREGTTARVKELEKALKVANEKVISSEKELQLARKESQLTKEELQSAQEELQTANGKLQTANGKLQQVTEENESLEGTVERLRAELEEAESDASDILEVSFDNAIQQVQLCHPELSIDRSIVHHLHTALGDRIQHCGPDGTVRVVFKGPTAL